VVRTVEGDGRGRTEGAALKDAIQMKKSTFDLFTPVFDLDNGGGLAVFMGSSAESNYKLGLAAAGGVSQGFAGSEGFAGQVSN
jgi:hypothetical protein